MIRPVFVGIGGPSGAGKSTIAHALAAAVGDAVILPLDAYYRDLAHLDPLDRAASNFDSPDAIDIDLVMHHVARLAEGHSIDVPIYNFHDHCRTGQTRPLAPARLIIIEGLHTAHWPALRVQLDLLVYVDADDERCFERRLWRDTIERGRTPESVREQYAQWVRPMAERYIWPAKGCADLLARGDGNVDDVTRQIYHRLRELGLLFD